ncbi:MAG: hypothetical protein D6701_12095 [Gemmatimonadetes bacterium]|nr:MAG: hypothetical protein D6701_12095 [Gemmatimonadota bacterium]
MKLQIALVCDDAHVDAEGKLDVHGVFHDLYAPGFPAKQDHMVLVIAVEWDRSDEGRYEFRVDLLDPEGTPTMSVQGHTDVDRRTPDRPPARTRLVLPMDDVVFLRPGEYRFAVRFKGRDLEGPTLYVMEAALPSAEAAEA